MAVFRIEKTRDYTVMSNHHLKDRTLTLKSKGLLSMMLSLPDEWNYTTRGLAAICREGVDSIGAALKELENHGYIRRTQLRDEKGKITDTEYVIYEMPQCEPPSSPGTPLPDVYKRQDIGAVIRIDEGVVVIGFGLCRVQLTLKSLHAILFQNQRLSKLHNDRRFLLNTFQKGVRHVAAGLIE